MKRVSTLAAVLVLVFSLAAFGAVQDFGAFTLNVPDGWTAQQHDGTAVVTKNDNSAQISVAIMETQGLELKDFANAFVEEFKKTFAEVGTPEADEDGDYSWGMKTAEGVMSRAFFGKTDAGKYALIVLTGEDEELGNIAGSVVEK